MGGSRGDDEMVKYLDVERPADLIELAGDRDILFDRARIAARMIVDEHDRSGIEFEHAPEDRPRIDSKLRKRSMLELLVGEGLPDPAEKSDAQVLGRDRAHRRTQILTKHRVVGVDRKTTRLN